MRGERKGDTGEEKHVKGGDSRGKNFLWDCASACSIWRAEKMLKREMEKIKKNKKKMGGKNMVLGTQSVESVGWRDRRSRENIRVADKT